MISLILILTFHYDLFYCDVVDEAASSPLKAQYGEKPARSDNVRNYSITSFSQNITSRIEDQTLSFLSSTIDHQSFSDQTTKFHLSPYLNSAKHSSEGSSQPDSKFPKPGPIDPSIPKKIMQEPLRNDESDLNQTMMSTLSIGRKMINSISTPTPSSHLPYLRQGNATDYMAMKKLLHEGYMVVFLIELTRLLATKDPLSVSGVVKHVDDILHSFIKKGSIHWLGGPLFYVTKHVAKLMKESEMNVIQDYADQMHQMISQRKELLTPETNQVLERAEKQFTHDDGELLFEMLKEFEAFPKISLSGYWLCFNLINTFLSPFRRMGDTKERQDLMDAINEEIRKRLNAGLNDTTVLRGKEVGSETSNEADSAEIEDTNKEFVTQKELVTIEDLHRTTTENSHKKQVRQKELNLQKELINQKEVRSEELVTSEISKELLTQKEQAQEKPNSEKKIIFNVKIITQNKPNASDASQELVIQDKIVASEEILASSTSHELINREKHLPFKKPATLKNIRQKVPVIKKQLITQKELSSEEFVASEEVVISKELLTQKEQAQAKRITKKKHITVVKIDTKESLTASHELSTQELLSSQELFNREKHFTFEKPVTTIKLPKKVKVTPKVLLISEELTIEKEVVNSKELDKKELEIQKELLNLKELGTQKEIDNSEELIFGKGLVNAKKLSSKKELGTQKDVDSKELGTQKVLKHKWFKSKKRS